MMAKTYGEDLAFLKQHVDVVELVSGDSRVAVVPAWQGRVMTSTTGGDAGASHGFLKYDVIEQGVKPEAERAGSLQAHIHVFGGEERFWFGPEHMDVRLQGVSTSDLRRVALGMQAGGVGYYPKSDFVHLDTGRVRFW